MTDNQKNPLAASGLTLMQNIRRIRQGRRLTYVDLSDRLTDVGRRVPVLGLARIERGERRVDVDDLVALAVALRVSPLALLLPWADDQDTYVEITGAKVAPAGAVWAWADGQQPLTVSATDPDGDAIRFQLDSRPAWARRPQ
jgi:transcriptional regulator with XRE-family HTH domain